MTVTSHSPTDQRRLCIEMDWRWHRPKRRPKLPKGEPRLDERPVRCEVDGTFTAAPAADLPFPDGSFDIVDCHAVFEHVRNDEGLAAEFARITAPGGRVVIRVPATGVLAGLDAFNLHRYLVDTTKRGLRPFETAELGWRRHYSLADLNAMMDPARFSLVTSRRSSLAVSEIIRTIGFTLFRWYRPSRNRYWQVNHLALHILSIEDRIQWPGGFWLTAIFERKNEPNS